MSKKLRDEQPIEWQAQSMEELHQSLCYYLQSIGRLIHGVEARGRDGEKLREWAKDSIYQLIDASETIIEIQKILVRKSKLYSEDTALQLESYLVEEDDKGFLRETFYKRGGYPMPKRERGKYNTGVYHLKKLPLHRLNVKVEPISLPFPWIASKVKK